MPTRGEEVYRNILGMIIEGSLSAGEVLQERVIADSLSVSRTPVREAISRLVAEGLVSRNGGQPPAVRRISIDDYIEILHVRRLLEVEAAGLAAVRADQELLAELREAVEDLLGKPSPEPVDHMAVDDLVHGAIARMSGSRLLGRMIQDLRLKTRIFDMEQLPERFQPSCEEHLAILEAIASGEAAAARKAMQFHIENVRKSIIGKLTRLF